jgi:TonB family protein
LTGLLVSLTLHTAALAFVPPLLSRPARGLKQPLWVDLLDLREDPPGLLSARTPPPPSKAAAETSPDLPGRGKPPSHKADPTQAPSKEPVQPASPPSRTLPSSQELIPSVNSLLGLQRAYDNPLYVEPSLEGGSGIHRGPQYEAYLQEVKEAVSRNWKVAGEGESKSGTTVLRILIGSDGSLASLDLLQSSGMILHDYEALEAIKHTFPFRPPPRNLLDENGKLSIRFSFHYFLSSPG